MIRETNIKKTTVQWRVKRLLEKGIIQRIGRGVYRMGLHKNFEPYLTASMRKIYALLRRNLDVIRYCMWSTDWVDFYLPKLPSKFYTIIEVKKKYVNFTYESIANQFDCGVYNFKTKDIAIISEKVDTIILVKPLISGSPIYDFEGIKVPYIEKVIVDLYCDQHFYFFENSFTTKELSCKVFSEFSINQNKLIRYANRRKRKKEFEIVFKKKLQKQ